MKELYRLNLELYLIKITKLVKPLLGHNTNGRYIVGERFFVSNNVKLKSSSERNILLGKPSYSSHSATLAKNIFFWRSREYIYNRELLDYNPMIDDNPRPLYGLCLSDLEYIIEITYPNYLNTLSSDAISALFATINKMITIMDRFIQNSPNSVYDVDIDSKHFDIIKLGSIIEYRYVEYRNSLKILNDEDNQEYNEDFLWS